jgi:hypothetical protein
VKRFFKKEGIENFFESIVKSSWFFFSLQLFNNKRILD